MNHHCAMISSEITGLPCLALVGEDAPNPEEIGGSGKFRGRVEWVEGKDILMKTWGREEVWDVEQSEGA